MVAVRAASPCSRLVLLACCHSVTISFPTDVLPSAKSTAEQEQSSRENEPPQKPPLVDDGVNDEVLDGLDGLDGTKFDPAPPGGRGPGLPPAKRKPMGAAAEALTMTKKQRLQEKKKAAAGGSKGKQPAKKPAAKKPAAKKPAAKRVADSSDEEEEEEIVDSSDEESSDGEDGGADEGRSRAGFAKPPPLQKPPPPLKQSTLTPKLTLAEIDEAHAALTSPAVEPALTADTAASRFVLVPASQFDAAGIGGWIARIVKVLRNKEQTTELQFKDGDGRASKEYFKFDHVAANFKPLS
jgi:hypothetical protein